MTFREITIAGLFAMPLLVPTGPAMADDLEMCSQESSDTAIDACTRGIKSGQHSDFILAGLYYNRAYAYDYDKAEYNKAIEDYSAAIRISPRLRANALTNRCSVYAILGQFQKALADCNESMKLSPNQSGRYLSRGFTYLKMRDFANAISDYNVVLELQPDYPGALYSRGIAKLRTGDSAGGNADIAAAKRLRTNIADEFEKDKIR